MIPNVVMTGAAGHLGSHLVPQLLQAGVRVTGIDIAPSDLQLPDYRFLTTDLGDIEAVKTAIEGADLIVHCASLHPWKPYSDAQYFDANVKGTWNLYRAAAELGVKKVVLTSSIASIGYAAPSHLWPVPEENLFSLSDLYSLTKHTQEDIARMFAAQGTVSTVALRPPAFFPRSIEETAKWITGAFLLVDDVVAAHVAAVKVMLGLQDAPALQPFEPIFIMQQLPYQREDIALFEAEGSMMPLLQKYYPQTVDWLKSLGYEGKDLAVVYDVSKAEKILGWKAQYDLASWFALHGPRD